MKLCKLKCPSLPVARKCCFCVPIRSGVIIFGYVNLVLTLLSFSLLIFILVEQATSEKPKDGSHNLHSLVHLSMTIVAAAMDAILAIVLLVGSHKKNTRLLKTFLYIGIVLQLLTLCMDLVYFDYREFMENSVYFFFLSLNAYLLFLVYSVIRHVEESSEVQYMAYSDPNTS